MNHDDNKHCTETAFSCRYHYNIYGSNMYETSCGEKDNPTVIELRPKNKSWPSLRFEIPRQRHELERVEALMDTAYGRGKTDQKLAISRALKEAIGI